MSVLGFLGGYFKRYWLWIIFAAATAGVFALATGALVVLIEPVFEEVLQTNAQDVEQVRDILEGAGEKTSAVRSAAAKAYEQLKDYWGVTEDTVVYFVPLLVIAVFLFRSVAAFVSSYLFQHIGLRVMTDIRNSLYRRILEQSSRFHAQHPSGELTSRIVNDIAVMQAAVSTRAVDLVQQSMTLVVLMVVLFQNNRSLALVCAIGIPAVLFPIVRFGQGMGRTSHKSQERVADLANLVGEGARGHRVVKAFGMEDFEQGRFAEATRRHLRVNLWASMLNSLSSPVIETMSVIGMCGLLVYAGLQIRQGAMSASGFIAFLFNLVWMYEPIRKLNKVNLVIQQSLAAVKRVKGLVELPLEIADRPNAQVIPNVEADIAFENISFAYTEQVVLRDVSLRIRKGEVVALVGPSGAGKSTLVNLLPRFFDPDSGCVRIDGIDIRDFTLESLRGLIGLVTQDTILFNDSVRNNIAYGQQDVSLERIREASAAAYADEFIMRLPQAYDTVIGESGLHLSGGQRQRLAIARALFKDAPILILDEATSQLDAESEALVQKALVNLMEGRTTMVIAHRLATVQIADRIVVLDNGRVVEQGQHNELMAGGGVYKRLYDLQFQE
ncbi:MAG: ABC transporter ATP-binding protein [bacterium]|nr:ABC transporter ATP-binding protein [bacterium]